MSEELNAASKIPESPTPASPSTPEATVAGDASTTVFLKLAEFGIKDSAALDLIDELGIEEVDDLSTLEVSDLTGAGIKLVKARKLYAALHPTPTAAPTTAPAAEGRTAIDNQIMDLLPTVPTYDSWLSVMHDGGVMKVDEYTYVSAIRAMLADHVGMYDIPKALVEAMERWADETDEQLGPVFFGMRKQLTRRNYADIFEGIDGLDGTFITDARRRKFLDQARSVLWPAYREGFRTLDSWYQTYHASVTDPSVFMSAISGLGTGLGMVPPPDTAVLHDAGDTIIETTNHAFRGTGAQVAAALAYDANKIREIIEDPRIPAMTGVPNREMMLKKIHANVSSNYVRLEQNLVRFVLGYIRHNTVTSDVEVRYFVALWQLGAQINWDELGGTSEHSSLTGLSGRSL